MFGILNNAALKIGFALLNTNVDVDTGPKRRQAHRQLVLLLLSIHIYIYYIYMYVYMFGTALTSHSPFRQHQAHTLRKVFKVNFTKDVKICVLNY